MEKIKVFFLDPTDRQKLRLRRYSHPRKCAKDGWGCDASVEFGECDIRYREEKDGQFTIMSSDDLKPSNADPRWPTACLKCGQPFEEGDERQLFTEQIYTRSDTGDRTTLRAAPPGACWNAWWISDRRKDGPKGCGYFVGPDGRCLVIRCPDGHDWMIDSRCSNCTLPNDNEHWCWVRTGRPEDGTLHVDKNGKTCAAGAGSIQTKNWHGFLHNGFLHE